MKRKLLLPALGFLIFSATGRADDVEDERLKELERKIAELQSEKAKLDVKAATTEALDPNGLFDAQGQVNQRITNAVVIIEGDKSVGTGFIAASGGKKYVYTVAHVFSGNSKLTIRNSGGTSFKKFGDLEAAEGADLVRMEILGEVKDALDFRPAEPPLQINKKIAALGNGGGTGVVAVEQGVVVGTSADILEVDAGIIQGNSGGPVVEVGTGKVVGLATHLSVARKDVWSDGTRQGKVRRFACRLDREWKWKTMKIGNFLADGKALTDYVGLTAICYELMGRFGTVGNYALPGGDLLGGSGFAAYPDNEIVKAFNDLKDDLGDRKGAATTAETKKKFRSLLSMAYSQATRTKDSLKPQNYAWFHRSRAEDMIKSREQCITNLNQALERFK